MNRPYAGHVMKRYATNALSGGDQEKGEEQYGIFPHWALKTENFGNPKFA